MVCESLPCDEEFETYIDDSEYEKSQNINICCGPAEPVPLPLEILFINLIIDALVE